MSDNEATEFNEFAAAVDAIEHTHDFIVIDTSGHDRYLMRLAHPMADTLITPLNDRFVDFDVLVTVDLVTFAVTGTSVFSNMVAEARRQRRAVVHATIDWIVVRNRLSMLGSRNKRLVGEGLQELSLRLGFRAVDGFAERVIFREFYPRGLTALDNLDEDTLGTRPNMSIWLPGRRSRRCSSRSSCRSTNAACGAPPLARSGSPRRPSRWNCPTSSLSDRIPDCGTAADYSCRHGHCAGPAKAHL